MPRPPKPASKHHQVIARATDETERQLIKYFKEVCVRDGLEVGKEIFKLIEIDWVRKHPPPGNPQKMLVQFGGGHEESTGNLMCEMDGCHKKAVFRCVLVAPFAKPKNFCRGHTCFWERRGELRGKKPLKDPSQK